MYVIHQNTTHVLHMLAKHMYYMCITGVVYMYYGCMNYIAHMQYICVIFASVI